MKEPKVASKAFFVIFCTIFFMILGGFIGARLIDAQVLQVEEAQAEVTQSMMLCGALGLIVATVLIVKLKPEQFIHASVILFAAFMFEIAFVTIVKYFHLF